MEQATAPVIGFDAATHRYTLDGVAVPGVSEIIEPAYDFRFVNAEAMERARDLGSKVHKTIELHELGTLKEASLHSVLAKHLDQYKRFKDDFGYISAGCEVKVASRKYKYCGTLDNWGYLMPRHAGDEEVQFLPDVKTGEVYAPHPLQTAGYHLAAEEMGLLLPTCKRASLYLSEDEYRIEWHNNTFDRLAFVSLRNFFHWKTHHGK